MTNHLVGVMTMMMTQHLPEVLGPTTMGIRSYNVN